MNHFLWPYLRIVRQPLELTLQLLPPKLYEFEDDFFRVLEKVQARSDVIGSEVDAAGVLQEPFFLIPFSYLSFSLGIIFAIIFSG